MANSVKKALGEGVLFCVFIVSHCVAAALVLVGGFLLHHMLLAMGDPRMFDVVPWRYVVDALDLTVMVVLFLSVVRLGRSLWRRK